jgi:predicted outer membrane repeat protein
MRGGLYTGLECCAQIIYKSNITIRAHLKQHVIIDCSSESRHLNVIGTSFQLIGISLINGFTNDAGGCVLVNADGASFSNVKLQNCKSNGIGGGMMLNTSAGKVVLTDVEFTRSSALHGGGIYVASNVTLRVHQRLSIGKNEASSYGGGIFFNALSVSSFESGDFLFVDNTAGLGGGAIYMTASRMSWSGNVTFTRNTALATSSSGGCLFANSSASIVATAGSIVQFQENSCPFQGGAVALFAATTMLVHGRITFVGWSARFTFQAPATLDTFCISSMYPCVSSVGKVSGADSLLERSGAV